MKNIVEIIIINFKVIVMIIRMIKFKFSIKNFHYLIVPLFLIN